MTSKERVYAAMRFQPVDRVPRFIWMGSALGKRLAEEMGMTPEELSLNYLKNDVVSTWLSINGEMEREVPQGSSFVDEWGITWKRDGDYNMVTISPMAEMEADEIAAYKFPDSDLPSRYEKLKQLKETYGDEYFVGADISGSVFEPAYHLRGMENLLMDMVMESDEANTLLDRTSEFTARVALHALECGADWIWLGDDLGSQQNMLMSPDCWRNMIKPRMKRIIDTIRGARPDALIGYHSCGSIRPVIGDLYEIGINLVNPLQESAAGMDHLEIKKEFGDKIIMMCGTDTQDFLLQATPEQVAEKTRQLVRDLGSNYGYVFAVSHTIQSGTPKENIDAMIEALEGISQS